MCEESRGEKKGILVGETAGTGVGETRAAEGDGAEEARDSDQEEHLAEHEEVVVQEEQGNSDRDDQEKHQDVAQSHGAHSSDEGKLDEGLLRSKGGGVWT